MTPSLVGFDQLRLEAIFYPKFDNEKAEELSSSSETMIRHHMTQRVQQNQGYLEVSLKHSGSLLLWSGGSRYYSKNSNNNGVTMVGEVLLRQHFCRAWWNSEASVNSMEHDSDDPARPGQVMYQACSDYLEQNRLTLAMEVVTAVLGSHGAKPHQDFIIVTALAQRAVAAEQQEDFFASTGQLLQVAHRFRLPHNDIFMLTSCSTVQRVLEWYDTQLREEGTASMVIPFLTDTADIHIASMYPHDKMQGEILEGIVVRFVSYPDLAEDRQTWMNQMQSHALQSKEILQHLVPIDRPQAYHLVQGTNQGSTTSIYSVNIRQLVGPYDKAQQQHQQQSMGQIEKALRNTPSIMQEIGTPRVERLDKQARQDFVRRIESLLLQSRDQETRRIAQVIQTIQALNSKVDYNVWRELHATTSSSSVIPSTTTSARADRYLCMIHVFHDETFAKYRRRKAPTQMELFRGFCIELVRTEHGEPPPSEATDANINAGTMSKTTPSPMAIQQQSEDTVASVDKNCENIPHLMLKMKLLPYMVRTFCCRNGFRILEQKGVEAFTSYCADMFSRWKISDRGKGKWLPFFAAWASYAHNCLHNNNSDDSKISSSPSLLLPPLSESTYLEHLEHFTQIYQSGTFAARASCTFRGLAIVVALFSNEVAKAVADCIGQALNGARRVQNVNSLRSEDTSLVYLPGGGCVCSTIVQDGVGTLKRIIKAFQQQVTIIFVGCTEDEINELSTVPEKEKKKLKGMLHAWCHLPNAAIWEFDENELLLKKDKSATLVCDANKSTYDALIKFLRETSQSVPEMDTRPGLLVIFPGIPGCGKSTICNDNIASEIMRQYQDYLKGNQAIVGKPRHVLLRSGDAVTQKFWPLIQDDWLANITSIVLADKNVPPPSWNTVGRVCSKTQGVLVPVLPDDKALETTVILGSMKPDGSFDPYMKHWYPFSLWYLAVCMTRVLHRPANTHAGKLDASAPLACLVVIEFYSFYCGMAAEDLWTRLRDQTEMHGARTTASPVRIPFFQSANELASTLDTLPTDLESALRKALMMMHGYDMTGKSMTKSNDDHVHAIENHLRTLITEYQSQLLNLTLDSSVSQVEFIKQVVTKAQEVDAMSLAANGSFFVELVAIDLQPSDVSTVLMRNSKQLTHFLGMVGIPKSHDSNAQDVLVLDPSIGFVRNLHLTLAHHSNNSQEAIHETYNSLCNKQVDLQVTGLLWSDFIAAFSIAVANHTCDGLVLPPPQNKFPHVTLWHHKNIRPVESNQLPHLVQTGKAQQVIFNSPVMLRGTVSFWSDSKH